MPLFLNAGFRLVDRVFDDPEWRVSGRQIRLERRSDGFADGVEITLDKYRSPRLTICFIRSEGTGQRRVRSAYLTRSRGRYFSEWGKPWWLPTRFWPTNSPDRLAERLALMAPQILTFIDVGTRGPNIGRDNPSVTH